MSTYNRSLVLEEVEETQNDLLDLLPMRYLFSGHASTDPQSAVQVVKISGNITVSF